MHPDAGRAAVGSALRPASAMPPRPAEGGGGRAWALGFLAYIPIPFLGQLLGGVIMAGAGASQRKRAGLVGAQGRHAANWGMTYALLTVLCVVGAVTLGLLTNVLPAQQEALSASALTVLGVWLFGVNLAHVVICIIGLVRAGQLREFRCPIAIPFFR